MRGNNRAKMLPRVIRMALIMALSFSLISGMGITSSAWAPAGEAETEVIDAGESGVLQQEGTDTADESADASDSTDEGDEAADQEAASETASESGTAPESETASEEHNESEPAEDTPADTPASQKRLQASQPQRLAAGESGDTASESRADECDFEVSGTEGEDWTFDPASNVLTITGNVTVKNKKGVASTGQRIVVADDCTVTLAGVTIAAPDKSGPAIMIQAESNAELVLADGTVNTVTGAHGSDINATQGGFAGIEVEFIYEDGDSPANKKASLTISGSGTLNATGGPNAAGIGGSNSLNGSRGYGLYGNITINSGTVNAESPGGGAGIGSSNNPGGGTSTGSYKKTGHNTWGTITINGGTVNAKSTGSGAGIGGGNHVDSGKIEINGGTVTADGAAGIGCGIGSSKNSGTGGDKGFPVSQRLNIIVHAVVVA